MPLADADGAELNYRKRGRGTPVLTLLPQSTGPEGRDALFEGLATRHTVIDYDQRGTGGSTPGSVSMSMERQAADAVAVLDGAGVERAHLVGHSTGCGIGVALASRHPQRVVSVSLVNPWTWGDPHLTTMQRLRIAASRALDPVHYARFNAAVLFPPEYRRRYAAGFARMADGAARNPHDPDDIERRLENILAFDARALLAAIAVPCAVVGARDDQLMPAWFAEEAAAALPHAELAMLDGGGHTLTETRTEAVLGVLLAHLERVDAAG